MLKKHSRKMISRLLVIAYLIIGVVLYTVARLAPYHFRPSIRIALIIYCIFAPVIGFTSYLIKRSGTHKETESDRTLG